MKRICAVSSVADDDLCLVGEREAGVGRIALHHVDGLQQPRHAELARRHALGQQPEYQLDLIPFAIPIASLP